MRFKSIHGAPLLLCVISALLIGFHFVDIDALSIGENAYLTVITAQIVIFAIPAVFYARLRGRKYLSGLKIRLFRPADLGVMVAAFGFMLFGGALISFGMYKLLPEAFAASSTSFNIADASGHTSESSLYALIAFAVVPAVAEEFLYRGVIAAEYENCGVGTAVIFSSLTFSLIHFSPVRIPIYFFYGAVLCLVMYSTRSLIASAAVHLANNVFVMFFEIYVYRAAVKQGGGAVMFLFLCISAFLLFAVFFFGAAQRNYLEFGKNNVPSPHAERKKPGMGIVKALISPAFILLILVSAFGMWCYGG